MMIQVQYLDGTYDFVKSNQLDHLLSYWKIRRFKRSSGWVVLGYDPVRVRAGHDYMGPERRGLAPGVQTQTISPPRHVSVRT